MFFLLLSPLLSIAALTLVTFLEDAGAVDVLVVVATPALALDAHGRAPLAGRAVEEDDALSGLHAGRVLLRGDCGHTVHSLSKVKGVT